MTGLQKFSGKKKTIKWQFVSILKIKKLQIYSNYLDIISIQFHQLSVYIYFLQCLSRFPVKSSNSWFSVIPHKIHAHHLPFYHFLWSLPYLWLQSWQSQERMEYTHPQKEPLSKAWWLNQVNYLTRNQVIHSFLWDLLLPCWVILSKPPSILRLKFIHLYKQEAKWDDL